MGRLVGEARISDFGLRSDPAGEGQNALGVGQDGKPVLLVARIHPATQDTRVDLREQIKGIFPRLYPIQVSVGPLDEVVHRYPQSCDYFSHVNSPYRSEEHTSEL